MMTTEGSSSSPWILRAGWVFPIVSPPIRDGVVVLQHPPGNVDQRKPTTPNRILWVGAQDSPDRPQGEIHAHYPDAVVFPGLVNAHAHIELSPLAGKITPGLAFCDWLRAVIQLRAAMAPDDAGIAECIQDRCNELARSGCTTVGDLLSAFTPRDTNGGSVVEHSCHKAGLRAVLYSELIGFAPGPSAAALERLERELTEATAQGNGVYRGAGPHAPYSAGALVIAESVRIARDLKRPFTIHVSEWADERDFLSCGGGPCEDLLKRRNNWDAEWLPPHLTPVDYLNRLKATGPTSSFVHCNHLDDDEIGILAETGTHVVHCPGSHHYFQRSPFQFHRFASAGVPVALGTDSLASNDAFDMLSEIRHAHRAAPDLKAGELLRMATLHGARALCLGERIGALETGREADVVAVPCNSLSDDAEMSLADALFGSSKPLLVIASGRSVVG